MFLNRYLVCAAIFSSFLTFQHTYAGFTRGDSDNSDSPPYRVGVGIRPNPGNPIGTSYLHILEWAYEGKPDSITGFRNRLLSLPLKLRGDLVCTLTTLLCNSRVEKSTIADLISEEGFPTTVEYLRMAQQLSGESDTTAHSHYIHILIKFPRLQEDLSEVLQMQPTRQGTILATLYRTSLEEGISEDYISQVLTEHTRDMTSDQ